jgi:16S rRNA A1518/A1519 N6-dimethyltransferase RsmA/KsgA/DIM1 with predicted DNA glycosylase/AP lyase activity
MQNNNPWKNFNPFVKTLPIPPKHYVPKPKEEIQYISFDMGFDMKLADDIKNFVEFVEYVNNQRMQELSKQIKKLTL